MKNECREKKEKKKKKSARCCCCCSIDSTNKLRLRTIERGWSVAAVLVVVVVVLVLPLLVSSPFHFLLSLSRLCFQHYYYYYYYYFFESKDVVLQCLPACLSAWLRRAHVKWYRSRRRRRGIPLANDIRKTAEEEEEEEKKKNFNVQDRKKWERETAVMMRRWIDSCEATATGSSRFEYTHTGTNRQELTLLISGDYISGSDHWQAHHWWGCCF